MDRIIMVGELSSKEYDGLKLLSPHYIDGQEGLQ